MIPHPQIQSPTGALSSVVGLRLKASFIIVVDLYISHI
jgi:hypothetical protein